MILILQILGVFFGLFMIYFIFLHFKRKEIKQSEYLLWLMVWLGFIVVALFPAILVPFTRALNLQRNMDLIIILGFAFLTGLMFNNYIALRKTQNKLENIVRKIALKNK